MQYIHPPFKRRNILLPLFRGTWNLRLFRPACAPTRLFKRHPWLSDNLLERWWKIGLQYWIILQEESGQIYDRSCTGRHRNSRITARTEHRIDFRLSDSHKKYKSLDRTKPWGWLSSSFFFQWRLELSGRTNNRLIINCRFVRNLFLIQAVVVADAAAAAACLAAISMSFFLST